MYIYTQEMDIISNELKNKKSVFFSLLLAYYSCCPYEKNQQAKQGKLINSEIIVHWTKKVF
jgi:hypothetical protein